MNISLPIIDFRSEILKNEKAKSIIKNDFEANHKVFAEAIASGFALEIISMIGRDLKNTYFHIPIESKTYAVRILLDLTTKNESLGHIKIFTKSCENLPPFKDWLERFSNNPTSINDSKEYFQTSFLTLGNVAATKLTEIFNNYVEKNPKCNILKFKVGVLKENVELRFTYWFDNQTVNISNLIIKEEKAPLTVKKEITISKKAVPVNVVKKLDTKDNPFEFFDEL